MQVEKIKLEFEIILKFDKEGNMHILQINHLTKDYGHGRGVFNVSFYVDEGEVYGFLGPNGAGKSTTIRHLLGFSKPDKGETLIEGKESFNHYYEVLKDVGYIPGEIAFPKGLTGYELIDMELKMKKATKNNRLEEMLKLFELDDASLKMDTKYMSLGVKRKLAVIIAFMSDPKILVLDEPTSGLDPKMQEIFISFIKKEKKRGKTILLSSHIFSEVDATCDRIGIIKDGKLVSEFIADDLKHNKNKIYEIELENKDKFISDNIGKKYLNIIGENNNRLIINIDEKYSNDLIHLLANYHISDFVSKNETLEDYFMKFYKQDKKFERRL